MPPRRRNRDLDDDDFENNNNPLEDLSKKLECMDNDRFISIFKNAFCNTLLDVASGSRLSCKKRKRESNGAVQIGKDPAKKAPQEPSFTCPVCWNKLEEPSTTICGHIFCKNCITQAIKSQKKCPTCRRTLKAGNHHRIYLPSSTS